MILLDSSALIEYYKPGGDPLVGDRIARAVRDASVCINGIIQVEIASFARSSDEYMKLMGDFLAFRWLDIGRDEYDLATRLGQQMRSDGFTVPATDLIIAASAIVSGVTLYHLDGHFDLLGERTALEACNIGGVDQPA